jgi:hypothetical protein
VEVDAGRIGDRAEGLAEVQLGLLKLIAGWAAAFLLLQVRRDNRTHFCFAIDVRRGRSSVLWRNRTHLSIYL